MTIDNKLEKETGEFIHLYYRFTLGESMKRELVDLIVNVYRANCRYLKKDLLANVRENLEVISFPIEIDQRHETNVFKGIYRCKREYRKY